MESESLLVGKIGHIPGNKILKFSKFGWTKIDQRKKLFGLPFSRLEIGIEKFGLEKIIIFVLIMIGEDMYSLIKEENANPS